MSNAPVVTGEVHQNLYLAPGRTEVQALITVDAVTPVEQHPMPPPAAAEVIVLDESESMGRPAQKLYSALNAAAAAIDELRDGVLFAVVAGSHEARMVFPATQGLVRADNRTRQQAIAALVGVAPLGGTAIGSWLTLTRSLLAEHTDAIRHAILLTDGRDEHESAEQLAAAVAECLGVFRCDCRGIGDDWSATELRQISRALLGSVDRMVEPSALAADFRRIMADSMSRSVPEVALQVWTPVGATVALVKQAAPSPVELTDRRIDDGTQVGLYPTGAWGTEQRDFHLSVQVPLGQVDQERLACRMAMVELLPDGGRRPLQQSFLRTRPDGGRESHPQAMISAIWTDDPLRAIGAHPRVLLSQDQHAVEQAVDAALAAYETGDHVRAEQWLDAARVVAERADMPALVERIDDLRDPVTGTYHITPPDMLDIGVESSKRMPRRDPSRRVPP